MNVLAFIYAVGAFLTLCVFAGYFTAEDEMPKGQRVVLTICMGLLWLIMAPMFLGYLMWQIEDFLCENKKEEL